MDLMGFETVISVLCLGGLTLGLATVLIVANRTLRVEEDPRIDAVEDLLPHANCGACGFPGCRPFAEARPGPRLHDGRLSCQTRRRLSSVAGGSSEGS